MQVVCPIVRILVPPASTVSEESARTRKRRETRQRISETGLRLFLAHGYEGTTLDAIAAEAGISRRTIFLHFKSKDDILFAWQEESWATLYADLLQTSPDVPPLDAVRDLVLRYIGHYTSEEMTAIDRLMRSSESLQSRKQAFYAAQEQTLYGILREVWRQPERRMALRMVAVVSVGAMRVATQAWNDQPEPRKPVAEFLREAFESLKLEL